MKFKWILLVAMLFTISGISINAQDEPEDKQPPPQERRRGPGHRRMDIEKLKAELKLSDEQCQKLKPILEKVKSIFEANRPQGKPGPDKERISREERKKKREEMQAQILAAIEPAKEFLNEEQFEALKEKLTKPPKRRPRRPEKEDRKEKEDKSEEAPDDNPEA